MLYVSDLFELGREALLRLGGKTKEASEKKNGAGGFPEDKIV
jgi:hypothetical protein